MYVESLIIFLKNKVYQEPILKIVSCNASAVKKVQRHE
jgi:hypothetical protein